MEARSLHPLKPHPLPSIYLPASQEHLPVPGPAFRALTDRQTGRQLVQENGNGQYSEGGSDGEPWDPQVGQVGCWEDLLKEVHFN